MIYEIKGEIRGGWLTRHEALTQVEAETMLSVSRRRHPDKEFKITAREATPEDQVFFYEFLPGVKKTDIPERIMACRRAEHQSANLRRQIMFDIFAEWDNDELGAVQGIADAKFQDATGYYYPGGRGSIKAF